MIYLLKYPEYKDNDDNKDDDEKGMYNNDGEYQYYLVYDQKDPD